jgi:hypothetical protein
MKVKVGTVDRFGTPKRVLKSKMREREQGFRPIKEEREQGMVLCTVRSETFRRVLNTCRISRIVPN